MSELAGKVERHRWTTHGYWIGEYQWTSEDEDHRPALVAKCGGPGMCSECTAEQKALWQKLAAARSVAPPPRLRQVPPSSAKPWSSGTAALTDDPLAGVWADPMGRWTAEQADAARATLDAARRRLAGRVVVDLPTVHVDDEGYHRVHTDAGEDIVGLLNLDEDVEVHTDDAVYTGPGAVELAAAILAVHAGAAAESKSGGA